MNKKLYLPLIGALLMMVSACNKPMKPLGAENFKADPNPLVVKGGSVDVAIDGKIPAKYFDKTSTMTITPVLVYGGTEKAAEAYTIQGEKVAGNNTAISKKEGGAFKMNAKFAYEPAMAKSELYLDFKVDRKGKTYTLPRVKIADGVIATEMLAAETGVNTGNLLIAKDNFQRIIQEQIDKQILFLIQQSNLRPSELKGAGSEFNKGLAAAKSTANKNIKSVEIQSYASPDGGFELNDKLAKAREKNTSDYLAKQIKKNKLGQIAIDKNYTAQDWDGFKSLVEASNIQDKELILRVLSTYSDPAEREAQIKNMSSVFSTLADDILPQLRRSRLLATIEVIGKSDEELKNLVATDAASLTLEEILYAATIEGVDAKAAYTAATKKEAADYRAYNNLGVIAFKAGDMATAESYFKQSLSKDAKAKEPNQNMGYLVASKGDMKNASTYFNVAGGDAAAESNGTLSILAGDYKKASNQFGSIKSNNAGLAQILNGDYNKAKATLSGVAAPNAMTSYLLAVVGARTNNSSMVIDNLKEAVAKDASLAKKAATDLEFAKFASNAEFQKIVK